MERGGRRRRRKKALVDSETIRSTKNYHPRDRKLKPIKGKIFFDLTRIIDISFIR